MTQHERVHLEGSVSVELAPEAAFALFSKRRKALDGGLGSAVPSRR
jgi:hypothetical protein